MPYKGLNLFMYLCTTCFNIYKREFSNNTCSRNNQHYAQVCTIALFYILAPTYFGRSLQSSGSCWVRLSYMKIQIDLMVYHNVVKCPVCWSVVYSVQKKALVQICA
jgi:hypothetical protein